MNRARPFRTTGLLAIALVATVAHARVAPTSNAPAGGACGTVYCNTNPTNAADISFDTCDCSAGSINVSLSNAPASQISVLLIGAGTDVVTDPGGALGDLCLLGSPIARYVKDASFTNSTGSTSVDILDATTGGGGGNIPGPVGGNVCSPAGQSWNFQFWHRDGMQPSRFSKAIAVTFQ